MARGKHSGAAEEEFQVNLERELQLMEEEGLWSRVAFKALDRYMKDPYLNTDNEEKTFIRGTLYFYKKSSSH